MPHGAYEHSPEDQASGAETAPVWGWFAVNGEGHFEKTPVCGARMSGGKKNLSE